MGFGNGINILLQITIGEQIALSVHGGVSCILGAQALPDNYLRAQVSVTYFRDQVPTI